MFRPLRSPYRTSKLARLRRLSSRDPLRNHRGPERGRPSTHAEELEALRAELQAQSDGIAEEKAALEQSRLEIEDLRSEAERRRRAEIDKFQDDVRREHESLATIRDGLTADRTALEEELRNLISARNELSETVDVHAKDLEQARAQLRQESQRITGQREALEKSQIQFDADRSAHEAKEAALRETESSVKAQAADLGRLEETLRGRQEEFDRRQKRLTAAEVERDAQMESIRAQQQSLAALQAEIALQRNVVDAARRESEIGVRTARRSTDGPGR